jgi:hypothetical protein
LALNTDSQASRDDPIETPGTGHRDGDPLAWRHASRYFPYRVPVFDSRYNYVEFALHCTFDPWPASIYVPPRTWPRPHDPF